MATPQKPTADDFERVPKDKARRYRLKSDHSFTISRVAYDKEFGRLKKQGFKSPEEQARVRREAGIPRPKGGRPPKAKYTGPTPPQRPTIPDDIADKLAGAVQAHGWFSAEFSSIEAAGRFIGYLPRSARVWIVAYGMLSPEYTGAIESDDEERQPEWAWKTVLANTLAHSVDIERAAEEANRIFIVVETWVVRWRQAQRIT